MQQEHILIKTPLSIDDINDLADDLCPTLLRISEEKRARTGSGDLYLHGVPNGGVPAAFAVASVLQDRLYQAVVRVVDSSGVADVLIDDIVDSGRTRNLYKIKYPTKPFLALIDKTAPSDAVVQKGLTGWIQFPWESEKELNGEDIVVRFLEYIGEDPNRQGLIETPKRITKAWKEWFEGYSIKEADVFKVFDDGAENYDQLVIVREIPFVSWCEHHGAAFTGKAHVGYIPNGKIVGLSKLARVVQMYAKRLQVQERMTAQIADAIQRNLMPLGVGVVIEAEHSCMSTRGVRMHGTSTVTSALHGAIKHEPETRAEFMSLIKGV